MGKELGFETKKLYDLADKSAEKYAILAYFKEQERAKSDDSLHTPREKMNREPFVPNQKEGTNDCNGKHGLQIETRRVSDCFTLTHLLLGLIVFVLLLILITDK